MTFEKKINFGNILTILTFLVSTVTFAITWDRDIQLQRRDQANEIRRAAALTLAKVERWEDISLSFYQNAQPFYVETSELLIKNRDTVQSRDYLWRELNKTRNETQQRILEEDLQTAYVALFSYHPAVKTLFEDTISRLESSEEKAFENLLLNTQVDILSISNNGEESELQSAALGNSLRQTAFVVQSGFQNNIADDITCLNDFLTEIIMKNDEDLLTNRIVQENCP